MMFKRKQIILVLLVAMVGVAGYLNWAYQRGSDTTELAVNPDQYETAQRPLGESALVNSDISGEAEETAPTAVEQDVLKQARSDKDLARSKAMETLNNIISSPDTTPENKSKAQNDLNTMAANMEKEGVAEGLLKTKGVTDCVVFATSGEVNASVKCENPLETAEVAKIQDVLTSTFGVSVDKVKITEIK
ncbi:MAG: SpoIIIAH-like family protein [Clostridia bacterium]|nr:SpoIIIAH-like family protein [Clostridia bacterium]